MNNSATSKEICLLYWNEWSWVSRFVHIEGSWLWVRLCQRIKSPWILITQRHFNGFRRLQVQVELPSANWWSFVYTNPSSSWTLKMPSLWPGIILNVLFKVPNWFWRMHWWQCSMMVCMMSLPLVLTRALQSSVLYLLHRQVLSPSMLPLSKL